MNALLITCPVTEKESMPLTDTKDLSDSDLKGDFSLSAIDTVTAIAAGVVA